MKRETRLILWNQFEILKSLYPDDEKDYDLKQQIVAAGYSSQYENIFTSISDEEASSQMQREVLSTLDMFRALDIAKRNGWTPSAPDKVKFNGFDGNNDPHYFFARYLLDARGLFQESAPNKNSHSSVSLDKYLRMVEIWSTAVDKFDLTSAEAEAIIAA